MSREKFMEPDELHDIIEEVYGRRGNRKLARDMGRTDVTISRWLSGFRPIGEPEAIFLRLILLLHRRNMAWRKWMAEYRLAAHKRTLRSVEDLL